MKLTCVSILLLLGLAIALPARAGEMIPVDAAATDDAGVAPPPAELTGSRFDDHKLELRPYLWTVNMKGDLGVNGIITPIDISFSDILNNLDFALAGTVELRHKKWGLFFDGNYLKISPSIDNVPLALFDTVGIEVKNVLLSMGIMYRIAEWERGFLDIGAGVSYTSVDQTLNLSPSSEGIRLRSEQLAEAIINRVAAQARSQVAAAAPTLPAPPAPVPVPLLKRIADRVTDRAGSAGLRGISNNLNADIVNQVRARFGDRIAGDGRVREKIKQLSQARVAEQAARVRGAVTSKLRKARERAENALADELERSITSNLPDSASLKETWWDVWGAIRARHFLTDKFYLNGFFALGGGGSDYLYQLGVGPGYEVNDWLAIELFYRRLGTKYENGSFLYDVKLNGLFLAFAIEL